VILADADKEMGLPSENQARRATDMNILILMSTNTTTTGKNIHTIIPMLTHTITAISMVHIHIGMITTNMRRAMHMNSIIPITTILTIE
jgi:hypothetical protein